MGSAVIAAIMAGHYEYSRSRTCAECKQDWPCQMVLAARAEDKRRNFGIVKPDLSRR